MDINVFTSNIQSKIHIPILILILILFHKVKKPFEVEKSFVGNTNSSITIKLESNVPGVESYFVETNDTINGKNCEDFVKRLFKKEEFKII